MALLKNEFFKIIKIIKEHNYTSICMLGKQNVHIEKNELLKISTLYGYDFDRTVLQTINDKYEPFDSVLLFKAYGIDEVVSLDYSAYEGADVIFDLNDELPLELYGKYELVLNGGTLEHIFDVAKAMDNMNKLVKGGGTIVHISPCAGWINHGFYSISPTFYQDYYALNNDIFTLKEIFVECKRFNGARAGEVYISMDCREITDVNEYLNELSSDSEKLIFCVAQKINDSIGTIKKERPIQGMYVEMHKEIETRKELYIDRKKVEKVFSHDVAIYGAGEYAKKLMRIVCEMGLEKNIKTIYDNDISKKGTVFCGIKVDYPAKDSLKEEKNIAIAIKNVDSALQTLKQKGVQLEYCQYVFEENIDY